MSCFFNLIFYRLDNRLCRYGTIAIIASITGRYMSCCRLLSSRTILRSFRRRPLFAVVDEHHNIYNRLMLTRRRLDRQTEINLISLQIMYTIPSYRQPLPFFRNIMGVEFSRFSRLLYCTFNTRFQNYTRSLTSSGHVFSTFFKPGSIIRSSYFSRQYVL